MLVNRLAETLARLRPAEPGEVTGDTGSAVGREGRRERAKVESAIQGSVQSQVAEVARETGMPPPHDRSDRSSARNSEKPRRGG